MEYKSEEYYEYWRWMSQRAYRRAKGEEVEPTPLQAERAKVKRNRWYKIAELLLDWQDREYEINEFARAVGFPSTESMYTYFMRSGKEMVDKYGALPPVATPSKVLRKYMDKE
jgi:hypothetical protein